MTDKPMINEKLLKILEGIYVEAHIEDSPNMVKYHGSLSPRETKIVQQAHDQIIELFRECFYEELLSRYYNAPCSGCPEGHASFWKTIIESDEWKLWTESNPHYDIPECEALGIMSKGHWKDFIKFITEAEKNLRRNNI